jgi:hypothetical protein
MRGCTGKRMKLNLDALRTEIQEYLEGEGFSIFHGFSRMMQSHSLVLWDSERHPDYKQFVSTAKIAGAKIIILNQREFSSDIIDDAVEQLEVSDLPVEDQRTIERRLKEMRVYEGFTCALELSYDYQGRVFMFDLQTDWYEDFSTLLEDLEFFESDNEEEDDDDSSISGYFSKN